jgi:hypothetical protein
MKAEDAESPAARSTMPCLRFQTIAGAGFEVASPSF